MFLSNTMIDAGAGALRGGDVGEGKGRGGGVVPFLVQGSLSLPRPLSRFSSLGRFSALLSRSLALCFCCHWQVDTAIVRSLALAQSLSVCLFSCHLLPFGCELHLVSRLVWWMFHCVWVCVCMWVTGCSWGGIVEAFALPRAGFGCCAETEL